MEKPTSISDAPAKFGVFAVYDPGNGGDIKKSENEFIQQIKTFLDAI